MRKKSFVYRISAGMKVYCYEGKDTIEHFLKIRDREVERLKVSFDMAVAAGYKKFIMFLHYPPTTIGEQESPFTRMAEAYGASKVIYSHCHGQARFDDSFKGDVNGIEYKLVSGDYLKLLDYGCGNGRVDFFLSYQTRCQSIGIEYDERIYEKAMENKNTAVSSDRISFVLANAEHFSVPEKVDRIYFFNPFSVEILQKVAARIIDSYYENPRLIQLFFYYPSDEYISYLMSVDELMFSDEIDCRDLFPGNNPRERIVIFEL